MTANGVYGTLPVPVRDGYTFTGWFTANDGGIAVNEGSYLSIKSDHTLYAMWEKVIVAVSGIMLDDTALSMQLGDIITLSAVITPEDATNTNVVWTSSDEKVATVSQSGEVEAIGDHRGWRVPGSV